CISVVRYARDYSFLGFYITRPDLRGQGIGHALWQHVMADRTARMTIGLDGVIDQQLNYRKSGFTRAHRNIRYGGIPVLTNLDRDDLAPIDADHLAAVHAYDREFFPAARENFLNAWLTTPGHVAIAAMTDDAISGYGVIRVCREGHKIGPLFADDVATAERLVGALVTDADAGAGPVFIDPPFANDASREMCERLGLAPVFETARMYRGLVPQLRFPGMFGITTFELG
ncbi:MAG: GNAT family N-acetyltransferase, partial [Rhodospirillaceae bacterium]|nr:GNAT family N-acetyltransferase [Rhodospirillaceae bacterium]